MPGAGKGGILARPGSLRGVAPVHEFDVAVAAYGELVLGDLAEPVARVEALRAEVLGPHADPDPVPALALQPVDGGIEQLATPATVLDFRQQVEALEFAVVGRDIGMRQAARPGDCEADYASAPAFAVLFQQPQAVARIGQQCRVGSDRMAFVEEGGQVVRRVQVAEGQDEGFPADRRQGRRVGRCRTPDRQRPAHSFARTATWTSASCLSGIGDGASVIRHCAVVVLGKAMTSRIDSVPAISAAMRSMPNAMPPCGGAPYRSASSRKPNLACASSAPMPSRSNTALCIDERWMRIEPPPISLPLSTMS